MIQKKVQLLFWNNWCILIKRCWACYSESVICVWRPFASVPSTPCYLGCKLVQVKGTERFRVKGKSTPVTHGSKRWVGDDRWILQNDSEVVSVAVPALLHQELTQRHLTNAKMNYKAVDAVMNVIESHQDGVTWLHNSGTWRRNIEMQWGQTCRARVSMALRSLTSPSGLVSIHGHILWGEKNLIIWR